MSAVLQIYYMLKQPNTCIFTFNRLNDYPILLNIVLAFYEVLLSVLS